MKKFYLGVLLLALVGVLAACGSIYEPEPVGVGADFSELKQSPCACVKVELLPALPQQFS